MRSSSPASLFRLAGMIVAPQSLTGHTANVMHKKKIQTMKINIKLLLLAGIGFCILSSCDKENNKMKTYEFPGFLPNQSEFTDNELFNATYTNYKDPEYFYSENLGDTSFYYINTVSIDSLNKDKWIELSTNDENQAFSWCMKSSPEGSAFKEGVQSEKFIEYFRTHNPNDNLLIKFRAHKKSYFYRNDYDSFRKSDSIGIFEKENFTPDDAKELIDYLYYIKNYQNGSSKLLSSFVINNQETVDVHHFELYIVFGDFDLYDEITLLEKKYEINKESGIIIISETNIRTINGEYN